MPYLVIGVVTGVLTFVTYLTALFMELGTENRLAVTLSMSLVSLAITFNYISRCVGRHCGHQEHRH